MIYPSRKSSLRGTACPDPESIREEILILALKEHLNKEAEYRTVILNLFQDLSLLLLRYKKGCHSKTSLKTLKLPKYNSKQKAR